MRTTQVNPMLMKIFEQDFGLITVMDKAPAGQDYTTFKVHMETLIIDLMMMPSKVSKNWNAYRMLATS